MSFFWILSLKKKILRENLSSFSLTMLTFYRCHKKLFHSPVYVFRLLFICATHKERKKERKEEKTIGVMIMSCGRKEKKEMCLYAFLSIFHFSSLFFSHSLSHISKNITLASFKAINFLLSMGSE